MSDLDFIRGWEGTNNRSNFEEIYSKYLDSILNYLRKFSKDENLILDIFQDSIIVLYENSQKPEFELTCSVQTYLTAICRNRLFKVLNNQPKTDNINELYYEVNFTDWFEELNDDHEQRLNLIESALIELKNVGYRCYELIYRYFFYKESMRIIAKAMKYTNAENAKQQKARCQKKLKELVKSAKK